MARPIFDEELHQLRSDVIEMAEFAKEAIEGSFDAVRQVSATKAYLTYWRSGCGNLRACHCTFEGCRPFPVSYAWRYGSS